jgi:tetratricopeptide (TPR) repeat protein
LAAPNAVPPRPSPEPGVNAPAIPDATQSSEFNENLFFDAEQIVPEGELAKKGAPSKVDPSVNPGSSLVITTTEHGASTKEAQLVAAERAHVLGRYESALEIYNNLYVSNKRDPNILFGRALSLQSLGRDEEAISAYEELLDIRPKNLEAQINMQGLIGKRYPAVALRALQDLYQDNPSSTALVSQVSIMEAQLGHYEEAIRFLGMAASMEPQNAGHLFNMAIIADRAGDKKAAVKYYEDALETDTLYGSNRSIPRESVYQRLAELR